MAVKTSRYVIAFCNQLLMPPTYSLKVHSFNQLIDSSLIYLNLTIILWFVTQFDI